MRPRANDLRGETRGMANAGHRWRRDAREAARSAAPPAVAFTRSLLGQRPKFYRQACNKRCKCLQQ
eukprot:1386125-Alexandrium_andersonii.AAC.1